jgi:protein SCO1
MDVEKEYGKVFQPIFISVDPARDTLPQISTYLHDFHPAFIGATSPSSPSSSGADTLAPIKSVCKVYRVYFSTPPNADPKGDYLVDHSIFIYFMDPRGDFVEAFGQSASVDEVVERVRKEIGTWARSGGTVIRDG